MRALSKIHVLGALILSFILPALVFGTIQEQIDAAVEGEIVLIYPGTYVENINFNGKNITVRSTYGPEVTIIDGNASGSTVTFNSGETSAVLNGFTIINGSGTLNDDGHYVGGGIACRFNSTPTLMNLIIENNNATGDSATGGGIMCSFGSDALIQDVIIRNNEADYAGGFIAYEASPTLQRVEIYGNHGRITGGGLTFWASASLVDEVVVYNNTASYMAGGIWVHDLAKPVLNQVTVTGNVCNYPVVENLYGGGLGISDGSEPTLINSILWDNYPNEIEFYPSMAASQIGIYSSDIEGGESGIETNGNGTVTWGIGNIDQDPEFRGVIDGNLMLADDSPCIDAGTPQLLVGGDTLIDMTPPDYWGANPDMGARELQRPVMTLEVPGAFSSIQVAIEYAIDGDSIVVAAGTYYENLNYLGKDIVIVSESGPELTIIDGSLEEDAVVLIVSGESRDAVLDGFTIQNGSGFLKYGAVSTERFGGGLCVRFVSSPTLRNLIVMNNNVPTSNSGGGGIGVAFTSEPTLQNILIRNNTSKHGGGLFSYHSSPSLNNITIRDNHAVGTGGGAWFLSSTPTINNIIVHNNTANYGGGGLWFYEECEVVVNQATIYGNDGGNGGGGILEIDDNDVYLINSICWDNTPNQIESYIYAPNDWVPSRIGIAYSDVQGGVSQLVLQTDGLLFYENNLMDSPHFTDPSLGDFSLMEDSPCIDAGTALFVWENDTLINLTSDEYIGLAPEMGAFEYGEAVGLSDFLTLPPSFALNQNFPNPFNPTTTFTYELPKTTNVTVKIYDVSGRLLETLVNSRQNAGQYAVQWNASGFSSGMYFYRIETPEFSDVQKMILMK